MTERSNIELSMALVDKKFIDVLGCSFWEKIMFIPEGRGLWLGIPAIEEKKLPLAYDERTRQCLTKQLLRKHRLWTSYMFSGILTRQYTIGTRGYESR